MRIQFQILLFLACINIATGLVVELSLPGSAYIQTANLGSNVTDYEERFNATDIAEGWQATPYSGIPVIGDVFGMFYAFFNMIRFLIDGFPYLLDWIGDSFITDASARTAFDILKNGFRAIYWIMISFFIIEFISGRRLPD